MTTKKKSTRKQAAKKPAAKRASTKRAAPKKAATRKPKAATTTSRPTAGSTIERTFKGAKHTVQITATGYAYKGTEYGSLTALAKQITGYAAVSGPRFFGTDAASKNGGQQ